MRYAVRNLVNRKLVKNMVTRKPFIFDDRESAQNLADQMNRNAVLFSKTNTVAKYEVREIERDV